MLCAVFSPGDFPARTSTVERLEVRQLLSGVGATNGALVSASPSQAIRVPLVNHTKPAVKTLRKLQKATPTTSPSMVYDYVGTLKTAGVFGLGSQQVPIELDITAQSLKSITGTASVGGHAISGTLTGKLLTNRKFAYKISGHGIGFTMVGLVSKTGLSIAGEASITLQSLTLFKLSGDFVAYAR